MSGFEFHQVDMAEIYREERMKEAELARLARQLRPRPPRQHARIAGALLWLGKQMIRWGIRLQRRYTPDIQVVGEPSKAHG